MTPPDDAKPPENDVLSGLPRTRPQRRSAKRDAPSGRAKAAPKAPASKPAAKTAPRPAATGAAKAAATGAAKHTAKPASTRAAAPKTADRPAPPPSGYATPQASRDGSAPADLVSTAIQAVGELAQIGAAVGQQVLKSALSRLPKL